MVHRFAVRCALGALAVLAVVAGLIVADVATVDVPSRGAQARADVPAPSWWDGDCDANRWNAKAAAAGWKGEGAHRLGASYLGIPVCGPRSLVGAPDVSWTRPGWGGLEWECVEYAHRFMALVYGAKAYGANGVDVVNNYNSSYGGGLVKVANGTAGQPPRPGDVVSFASPTNRWGHVAVVASSTVDGNGNGSVRLLTQNDTTDGWRTLSVKNWTMSAFGSLAPYGWLHDPLGRGGGGLTDNQFVVHDNAVYRLAGGAPIYVSTWDVFGGVQPYTVLSDDQWSKLAAYPREGTYLRDPQSTRIYRVVGGYAMYVSSCAPAGLSGCGAYTDIDPAAVTNAGGAGLWNHLRPSIADGTWLKVADGSAKLGLVARALGGSLLWMTDCGPLGGCGTLMDVNDTSFDDYSRGHPNPTDGAVAMAQPSNAAWYFGGGICRKTPAGMSTAGAVVVNDNSLSVCVKPLQIGAAPAGTLAAGRPSTAALSSAGGSGQYQWSLAGGSLPAGVTLSPDGTLAGTPTTVGTTTATVTLADGLYPTDTTSATMTLVVVEPPSITTAAPAPMSVGSAFSLPLTARGGTAGYRWSVPAGSLPPGVSLTDAGLTGTPRAVGSWPVTVTVTDSSSPAMTADMTFTIVVSPRAGLSFGPPAG